MSSTENEGHDVAAIISSILRQRADQKQIPLGSRTIEVSGEMKDNFKVSRRRIAIRTGYILTASDPVAALDPIIEAVVNFEAIPYRRKAERITLAKSVILGWAEYLRANLSHREYAQFLTDLIPPSPTNGLSKASPEELEGEHFLDRGIPFQP